jgi:hypothetical protein
MGWTLLPHAAATLWMVGLIWFVQVVHYPLFARVGRQRFAAYEAAHTRRTGWVVGPPMLVEAATAVLLAGAPPEGVTRTAAWAGLGLLGTIWLSTALLQVPAHRRLERGFDAAAHRRLVATNWIRTVAWSLRGALALSWLRAAAGA